MAMRERGELPLRRPAPETPLRFEFVLRDHSLGQVMTASIDLPARPLVGDAVMVEVDGGRGAVTAKLFVVEVCWHGIPYWDKGEACGSLLLDASPT